MSIVWLTENYPPQRGGMAQSCDRIVDQLRKRGFVINVVHFSSQGTPYLKQKQINGSYTAIPFEESEAHTLNCAWPVIQAFSASLCVCFGGYLPMVAAPIYSQWLGIPLLTLIRGNDFDSSIFTPRKREIIRDALGVSAAVTVVSKDKLDKIGRLFPQAVVQYIPNGIDVTEWLPSTSEEVFASAWRAKISDGKICLGIFGQLKAKKGASFFLNVIRQSALLKRLHLLFIGEVSEEVQSILSSNEFSFDWLPFMDRYELLRYYLCCDAVVIPSFYDGMPNVLLEAGALGIPVMASCVDGMKDVIVNNVNGLLFEPGDTGSCLKALHTLVEMTAVDRKQLGVNLREVIRTNYNSKLETDNYEIILNSLLDRFRPAVGVYSQ